MAVSPIQVLAVIFISFALSRAILRAKDRKISPGELLFWILVWGGLVAVVFFPDLVSAVAARLGIGRGVDAIVYTSVGLLFYLIFRLYVKLEETESRLTQVVRELALDSKRRKRK